MTPTTAREWLDLVLDPGWHELSENVVGNNPLRFPGYQKQLDEAIEKTGEFESVIIASGHIDTWIPVIAISFEFGFLGGSMGTAAGERICRAFEHAIIEQVPVVALIASGGARMQEGMAALAQMPATLAARGRLARRAQQPLIAYLRNPTTGGVFASFASSADVIWAQPGATVGFVGPRVAESVTGTPLPEDSHTAESALRAGLVDELVEPEALRDQLIELFRLLGSKPNDEELPNQGLMTPTLRGSAWEFVQRARAADRPTGIDYVLNAHRLRVPPGGEMIKTGFTWIGGYTVVFIAQDRRVGMGRSTPAAYRGARAAIATACRLGLPIVTFIDTPGAEPGAEAERAGIAAEIAATIQALLDASVPTVACVVGEGGSGGALALAACDRILIQEDAIFSVIAPEAAAAILKRSDVEAVAESLRLTAEDLQSLRVADDMTIAPFERGLEDARQWLHDSIREMINEVRHEGIPSRSRMDRWREIEPLS